MEDTAVKDNDHDLERRKEERRKGAADLGDALNRINLIINSTFNYEKIMDSVVVEAAKAIGCEASSVALREGANWIIRHVHGMAREWLGRSFSDKEAPHALFAEVSKRPVAINDAFTDKRTNNEVMRAMGVRSVLVIPLLPRGKIRGDLFFTYHSAAVVFSDAQIDFANKLGAAVSLALDNASLYEELSRTQERERFFADVIETSARPFAAWYPDGRLMIYNHAFTELTGYHAEELKQGKWATDLTHPGWREYEAQVLEKLHRTGEPQVYEKEYVRKDSFRVPVEIIVHRAVDAEGQVQYYYAFISDITERKKAESDLRQAKKNLEAYVNELEQRNREIEMLSAMGGLLQASLTVEEAHGIIAKSLQQLFAEEAGAIFLLKGAKNVLESIAVWGDVQLADYVVSPKECWALRLGRVYTVETPCGMRCPHVKDTLRTAYICIPMVAHNETLGLLHLQLSAAWSERAPEERTRLLEHKKRLAITTAESVAVSLANFRLREVLYNQSIRDPLTELFNRRYMKEMVEREIHRTGRKSRPLGIIMLDIDYFKQFNDTYGHEAGDLLLHELGVFLQRQIREEDFACRYGGEEFVIVMPETSLENARRRAEQVRERVKSLTIHYLGDTLGPVTLSLGIAVFPEHGITTEELLRAADTALYRAKAEGRDRVITAS